MSGSTPNNYNTVIDYQKLAMRTKNPESTSNLIEKSNTFGNGNDNDFGLLIEAALGLSGEVGELNDMLKKWIFHKKAVDVSHLEKEIGDICWYIAAMCEATGLSFNSVLETNIEKLKARYPQGFDTYRANHRAEDDV